MIVTDDEKLVAYCGLYCGECFGHKGKIPDLARDLRKELRSAKFEKFAKFISQYPFAKVYEKYPDCYEVLGAMVKFRCKKACKDGGGPPFCKMRKCCQKNGYNGCWECDEFETCEKLKFLEPVHDDAHLKNMRKIRKKGMAEFMKGKKYW
jgi:hypothetical protein